MKTRSQLALFVALQIILLTFAFSFIGMARGMTHSLIARGAHGQPGSVWLLVEFLHSHPLVVLAVPVLIQATQAAVFWMKGEAVTRWLWALAVSLLEVLFCILIFCIVVFALWLALEWTALPEPCPA